MEKHPLHLKIPDLQTSPEVAKAVQIQERHTGEKVPNSPNERVEAYMDRLENVFLNPDERVRERNLDMFRENIYDQLIIKKENFPESYFELQKRIAREQGHGDIEISSDVRERMMDTAIEDQKHSLDAWMEYLASEDAVYPAWFKYYAWTQVTKLSQFDKERGEFKKRTASTVAPFPDIYRSALAQIADLYERVKDDNKDSEARREFDKKFPALYAEKIQEALAAQMENKGESTRGEWVKYAQEHTGDTRRRGTNRTQADELYDSLQGKGTGWCTEGRSTAETQIENGDFYVYYTFDQSGKPSQPRLAIRMNGTGRIGEVRGILPHQNVEPIMEGVLDEKLKEFGSEAAAYRKKSADMKHLTELEEKQKEGAQFTKDDLVFLYEMDAPIEGFGYDRDPRIRELVGKRSPVQDAPIVFGCDKNDIAWLQSEITPNTKAYLGPLFPGVFQSGIEHIGTNFPEGMVHRYSVELGGMTKEQLKKRLEEKNIYLTSYADDLLKSKDFSVASALEAADLVRLTVSDLGFPQGATTDKIYARAAELGLDLCPAEVGPQLRLSYTGNDWTYIAMKQITGRDGNPRVFYLDGGEGRLGLSAYYAKPAYRWPSDRRFVFRLRKALKSSDSSSGT